MRDGTYNSGVWGRETNDGGTNKITDCCGSFWWKQRAAPGMSCTSRKNIQNKKLLYFPPSPNWKIGAVDILPLFLSVIILPETIDCSRVNTGPVWGLICFPTKVKVSIRHDTAGRKSKPTPRASWIVAKRSHTAIMNLSSIFHFNWLAL